MIYRGITITITPKKASYFIEGEDLILNMSGAILRGNRTDKQFDQVIQESVDNTLVKRHD